MHQELDAISHKFLVPETRTASNKIRVLFGASFWYQKKRQHVTCSRNCISFWYLKLEHVPPLYMILRCNGNGQKWNRQNDGVEWLKGIGWHCTPRAGGGQTTLCSEWGWCSTSWSMWTNARSTSFSRSSRVCNDSPMSCASSRVMSAGSTMWTSTRKLLPKWNARNVSTCVTFGWWLTAIYVSFLRNSGRAVYPVNILICSVTQTYDINPYILPINTSNDFV